MKLTKKTVLGILSLLIAILFVASGLQPTTTSKPAVLDGDKFLVSRVIDGDTIELAEGHTVRYIGIDTPETVKPNTPIECFGKEASKRNKELVEGKYVSLEKDVNETDKYGRLLRYVYTEEYFINKKLVEDGYAESASFPPDIAKQSELDEAERYARENKLGLWGKCNEYD